MQFNIRVTIHEIGKDREETRDFPSTKKLEDGILNDLLIYLECFDHIELEKMRKFGLTISLAEKVK